MDLRHHTYRNACEFDKVLYKYLIPGTHLQLYLYMLGLYLVLDRF